MSKILYARKGQKYIVRSWSGKVLYTCAGMQPAPERAILET